MPKILEKNKAINLRKKGFSYGEILKLIPVAKSTLSLWLKSVGLSKKQKQRLTDKKLKAMQRGWESRQRTRIESEKLIKENAKKEIGGINKKDLWLIGVALYWAEGSKSKKHNVSQCVSFNNSDPLMIKIFIHWLKSIIGIKNIDLIFEIYIHEMYKGNIRGIADYWSKITGFNINSFKRIYFKKNKINTHRRNIGDGYYGLLRIKVRKSTNLNRKISGWIEGICQTCGIV